MIAVDANILVYSFRADSPHHAGAARIIEDLEFGTDEWSIPSSCLREFVASVTNRRKFADPTPLLKARQQVNFWLSLPNLVVLSDNDRGFRRFPGIAVRYLRTDGSGVLE